MEMNGEFIYHVNISPLIELGKWLDYLRENKVYDNTRIIIVADHGHDEGQFPELIQDDGTDMQAVIPILLYKDFDSKEFAVSDEFMTNADTPVLAMEGLIQDPVNPFTGVRIDDLEKTTHVQLVLTDTNDPNFEPQDNMDNNTFVHPLGQVWYTVHDDVYDKTNWTRVEM